MTTTAAAALTYRRMRMSRRPDSRHKLVSSCPNICHMNLDLAKCNLTDLQNHPSSTASSGMGSMDSTSSSVGASTNHYHTTTNMSLDKMPDFCYSVSSLKYRANQSHHADGNYAHHGRYKRWLFANLRNRSSKHAHSLPDQRTTQSMSLETQLRQQNHPKQQRQTSSSIDCRAPSLPPGTSRGHTPIGRQTSAQSSLPTAPRSTPLKRKFLKNHGQRKSISVDQGDGMSCNGGPTRVRQTRLGRLKSAFAGHSGTKSFDTELSRRERDTSKENAHSSVDNLLVKVLHKQHAAAAESEYPQFGVVGQSAKQSKKTARGDQRMAYSAQLHHYQQTKQKIISLEQSGMDGQREHESEGSEDEQDEGDYSVYECPGLAPTGDIEVSNPMFEKSKSQATTPNP